MNFQDADEFNAARGNQFIADLMPKHPIYTAMLPESARAVIGVPHPTGRAAMRMLENEGFEWEKYVDIFDGGPTMSVKTDAISSIKHAQDTVIAEIISPEAGEDALISTGRLAGFRSAYGRIERRENGVLLSPDCAALLGLSAGDQVTHISRN
jgi:arginine N-succinyltransferase